MHCVKGKAQSSPHLKSAGCKLPKIAWGQRLSWQEGGQQHAHSWCGTQRCFSATLCKVWSINTMLQVSLQKIIKVLSLQFGVWRVTLNAQSWLCEMRCRWRSQISGLRMQQSGKVNPMAWLTVWLGWFGKLESQARTLKKVPFKKGINYNWIQNILFCLG